MTTLLSLIGEQPIPVLLVDRALRPDRHVLLHTTTTARQARNLEALLPHAERHLMAPYDLDQALHTLQRLLAHVDSAVLNLTAGTKPMAWAGYEAARQVGCPFVYLQSEGGQSVLYRYRFTSRGPRLDGGPQRLPALITLDDYLRAHGLQPPARDRLVSAQEKVLAAFFRPRVDEMRHGLQFPGFEIDFLLRRGNRVAVVEAKESWSRNKRRRDGLDQLTTIAGREYLGTYTGKIWVVARPLGEQMRALAEAYRVQVVVVERQGNRLTEASERALQAALDRVLPPG